MLSPNLVEKRVFLNQAWGERKGWEGLKTGKLKQLREEEGWIADALGF